MDLGLKDKVVIVTGGQHGLGKAICTTLAREQAKVAVACLPSLKDKADALAAELTETYGVPCTVATCDVSSEDDVIAMYDKVEAELGPVDALVNNAAYCPTSSTADLPVETFKLTLNVNMVGVFLCSRELVRRATGADRKARIVNISSQAAFRGSRSGKTAYDSSKMGIIGFTISLALEMASKGIAVNAVAPGLMYTEMIAAAVDADPDKFHKRAPIGRMGDPQEIADVAVFLASERASYMTGATVDVSGGLAMH